MLDRFFVAIRLEEKNTTNSIANIPNKIAKKFFFIKIKTLIMNKYAILV